jgi:aryl-alcohol dehydrogenase-like predicted oxidoreductase
MKQSELGTSGLSISPICLGTMTFGRPVAEAEAIRMVHGAIDLGINFIDTANVYEGYDRVLGSAGGVAEEILGKAIKDRRDQVIVATKVCAPVGPGPGDRGLSAAHILEQVDHSLRRLQVDVIDLYIMHWPDKLTPLEESLTAMDQALQQGKVRFLGSSNHDATQLCEMLWIAERNNLAPIVASQIPFSLLRREFQHDLTFCSEMNICVTPYQPLQGGLLTGKYRRDEQPPGESRGADKPQWLWELNDDLFDRLEGLEQLAADANLSMAQFSLAWALSQPAIGSLVVGASRLEQVEQAVAAAGATISDELLLRVDEICPPPWTQPDPIRG